MTISELNIQINQLTKQRNKLIKELKYNEIKEFCKLEWVKDTDAVLMYRQVPNLSNYEYKIFLYNDELPHLHMEKVCIYGSEEYGIYYQYVLLDSDPFQLMTNSPETLTKFLENNQFKSLRYYTELADLFSLVKTQYPC